MLTIALLRRGLWVRSGDAGAKLLRALGVKGHEVELRSASDEFSGHSLALTLLGSYLTDAYNGDIGCRKEVSARLAHDARQGVHARKVMESYQTWFREGPELSVLRMLGLFDRSADEKALGALLKPPAIRGLTESLIDLSPTGGKRDALLTRNSQLLPLTPQYSAPAEIGPFFDKLTRFRGKASQVFFSQQTQRIDQKQLLERRGSAEVVECLTQLLITPVDDPINFQITVVAAFSLISNDLAQLVKNAVAVPRKRDFMQLPEGFPVAFREPSKPKVHSVGLILELRLHIIENFRAAGEKSAFRGWIFILNSGHA
jgi:hypothetical protein